MALPILGRESHSNERSICETSSHFIRPTLPVYCEHITTSLLALSKINTNCKEQMN